MNEKNSSQSYANQNRLNEMFFEQKSFLKPQKVKGTGPFPEDWELPATLLPFGENDFLKIVSKGFKTNHGAGDRSFFPSETLHKVCALATFPPEEAGSPLPTWTMTELTDQVSQQNIAEISRSTVWRLLDQAAIKPHKWQYWLNSPDPDFEKKMLHIVNIYLHPPRNGIVICLDEKTAVQALERKYADHPMEPGKPCRREHSYIRHGTRDLLAAFEVSTGTVFGKLKEGHSAIYWEPFIKEIVQQYDDEQTLHFIQDNASTHSTPSLCRLIAELCNVHLSELPTQEDRRRWLSKNNKRIIFHYLPTHASWLNQIEVWFSSLTRRFLKRSNFKSIKELVNKFEQYLGYYNEKLAHPYSWTYTGKPLAV